MAVSEIEDHKPESKNKTDNSNRNLKTMKNLLTIFDFGGWTRRTESVLEAWRRSVRVFLRENKQFERSDKKGTRVNENSFHLFCLNSNRQRVRRYKFLKSDLWHVRKVRRHLMFQKISFLKAENVGFGKDSWWDCSEKFSHWSNNQKTWGANVYSNFHSDDVAQF